MTASHPPEAIAPMLATPAESLPRDDGGWGYEFKWDGIRAIVFTGRDGVRVQGRKLTDVTHQYPELADLAAATDGRALVLDGELVSVDERGRPSFERLQQRMNLNDVVAVQARRRDFPVTFLVFDLLAVDGASTMDLPYVERRARLDALALAGAAWQSPAYHAGAGVGSAMSSASRDQDLEGVLAKRLDSVYEPGRRSRNWLKIKNHRRQELVVGGWTRGTGARERMGSLLVGYYDGDALRYAGNVGTGFTEKVLSDVLARLHALRRDSNPFTDLPPTKGVTFVAPELVVEVEFTEWTAEGRMRHPSFKGLRFDKDPREVVRET